MAGSKRVYTSHLEAEHREDMDSSTKKLLGPPTACYTTF